MSGLVSVVLAVHNGEKYLAEQLQSLLAQTHRDLEIIALDDASGDGSLALLQKFSKKDARLRIVSNPEKLGYVNNFLKGVSLAQGDYVAFCDQDDCWRNDKIAVLKRLMDEHPSNRLAYSDLEICDERMSPMPDSFWVSAMVRPRKGVIGAKALVRNLMPGCSMLFDRNVQAVMRRAPRNPPFIHDHLAFVIAALSGRIVYSRERLVQYRQHAANEIGAFYPSVMDRAFFLDDLKSKIDFIETLGLRGVDLRRIRFFAEAFGNGNLFQRIFSLDYYLFLRRDQAREKMLCFVECLAPTLYKTLRRTRKGRR